MHVRSRPHKRDLSHDLGPPFAGGSWIATSVAAAPRTPVYHSVGASDAIEPRTSRPGRRRPAEHAGRMDHAQRPDHFKIKLNGGNEAPTSNESSRIDRIVRRQAGGAASSNGTTCWTSTRDARTSATCSAPAPGEGGHTRGFERIKYIEQPTARDLKDRANVMTRRRTLSGGDRRIVDGPETLLVAREMGYTGVALKACKGQSQAMSWRPQRRSSGCSSACRT